jgi:hypothetical protein
MIEYFLVSLFIPQVKFRWLHVTRAIIVSAKLITRYSVVKLAVNELTGNSSF